MAKSFAISFKRVDFASISTSTKALNVIASLCPHVRINFARLYPANSITATHIINVPILTIRKIVDYSNRLCSARTAPTLEIQIYFLFQACKKNSSKTVDQSERRNVRRSLRIS